MVTRGYYLPGNKYINSVINTKYSFITISGKVSITTHHSEFKESHLGKTQVNQAAISSKTTEDETFFSRIVSCSDLGEW